MPPSKGWIKPWSHAMARAAAFGVVLAAAVYGGLQFTDVDPSPLAFPPLRPLPSLDGPDATELVDVERLFEVSRQTRHTPRPHRKQ